MLFSGTFSLSLSDNPRGFLIWKGERHPLIKFDFLSEGHVMYNHRPPTLALPSQGGTSTS